jgi:ssDNA-binding Zn-finger/Zn-ribbon topoisomerase 1
MELRQSRYGLFWGCSRWPECDGTHGAHPDGRPLGIPADKRTKEARIAAHAAFDRWWKKRRMKRSDAYNVLRRSFGLSEEEAHIGRFTIEQCVRLIAITKEDAL